MYLEKIASEKKNIYFTDACEKTKYLFILRTSFNWQTSLLFLMRHTHSFKISSLFVICLKSIRNNFCSWVFFCSDVLKKTKQRCILITMKTIIKGAYDINK